MIACLVPSMSFAITHSFQHIFFPIYCPVVRWHVVSGRSTKADGGQAKKFSLPESFECSEVVW
jgi:hypothetical protein